MKPQEIFSGRVLKSTPLYEKRIKELSLDSIEHLKIQKPRAHGLDRLMKASGRVILDVKAVFPFNFFPDELILDETKISVHTNYFFFSKEVRSIEYKDIFNVTIQQGIFFAKIVITDRYYQHEPLVIPFLWKGDAILSRRIIQGMLLVKKENIDIHDLSIEELRKKLERIGKTR